MTAVRVLLILAGIALCAVYLPAPAAFGVLLISLGLIGLIFDVRNIIPGDNESAWGGHE